MTRKCPAGSVAEAAAGGVGAGAGDSRGKDGILQCVARAPAHVDTEITRATGTCADMCAGMYTDIGHVYRHAHKHV